MMVTSLLQDLQAIPAVTASITLIVLFLLAVLFYRRSGAANNKSKRMVQSTEPASKVAASADSSLDSNSSDDVWAQRRAMGISAASNHERKTVAEQKVPFGSSYYYAHNSSKASGGYKDGLTMEDFAMNGPRLLRRRGGKSEDNAEDRGETTTTRQPDGSKITTTVSLEDSSKRPKRILLISRYLWDDPGDSDGVATIRIEQLPSTQKSGTTTTELIGWKDAGISEVSAKLVDNGLLVVAHTKEADVEYRLHISSLYGEVSDVKTIVKTKRLLIKLYKKSGMIDKSNLKAWPHPQKKA